jgi:hypothetical protein
MTFRFIGQYPRSEDLRLVRGLGRYTADLAPPDACRLFMVRSPHAAARVVSIDTQAAAAIPGVQLVLTGESPELRELGTFTSKVKRKAPGGSPNFEPPYRTLARERAQFAGDAVASVFADTPSATHSFVSVWRPSSFPDCRLRRMAAISTVSPCATASPHTSPPCRARTWLTAGATIAATAGSWSTSRATRLFCRTVDATLAALA